MNTTLKKPDWIKVKAPISKKYQDTYDLVRKNNLNTVCEEAACPNIGECWEKKHATVMILGSICTRACAFCNITTGMPGNVSKEEPENLAKAVAELGLKHVVITSVDRDDLPDGGAMQFVKSIQAIRNYSKDITIEILTPDFLNKPKALEIVVKAKPDVYNHNIETVPALYAKIRPGARYFHSLNLLWRVKQMNPLIFSKSGLMLGLGETKEHVLQVMDDLRAANVDMITIGQYLPPTKNHAQLKRYVSLEEFKYYKVMAKCKGFIQVSSSPLTRSSYHADDDFKKLKESRVKELSEQ